MAGTGEDRVDKIGLDKGAGQAEGRPSKPAPHRAPRRRCGCRGGCFQDGRVLRLQQPERLSARTAAHIREVADQLGYRHRSSERLFAQKNTMTAGLLTPHALSVTFGNPFFAELCAGVASVTDQAGYGLLFISRCTARWSGPSAGRPSTASSPSACRRIIPKSSKSGDRGCPWCLSTARPCPSMPRSNRTTKSAPARRRPPSAGARPPRPVVVGIEPPNMPASSSTRRAHRIGRLAPADRLSAGFRTRRRQAAR